MIANLQLLRAIAALMVVLVHLQVVLRPFAIPAERISFLHGGVDIFFVISGFIMVHVTGNRPVGPGAFIADRLTRIAPTYWLFTLVVFAVARLMPGLGGFEASLADLVRSAAFIPYGHAPHFPPLVYVGWTLNLEIFFYLLFALAMALTGRLALRITLLTAMLAVPVIAARFAAPGTPLALYGNPMVFEFVFGMIIAACRPQVEKIAAPLAWGIVALAAAAIIADPLQALTEGTFWRFGWAAALLVIGALALEAQGRRAGARWVLVGGAISYPLYITHPLVLSAFNNVQDRVPSLMTRPGGAVLAAVGATAALVFAWLVHRGFELPATRLARRGLGLARPRASA